MNTNGQPMTAANQGNGTSPDGQPAAPAQPQQGNAAQSQETYTRAEVDAKVEEVFNRAKNLYDAGVRRSRFSQHAQAVQAQPAPQPAPTPQPQPVPAQGQPDQGANGDPFLDEALRYMQSQDCFIDETDPEIAAIDAAQGGFALIVATKEAVAAKKSRLASGQQPPSQQQAPPATQTAPTNLAGGGTRNANPIRDVTDPHTLLKMGLSKGG